jgi:23S rRNA (guanosine2251-2'-O)-methyltransferase
VQETLLGRNAVHEALCAGRRRIERVLVAEGVQERGIIAEIVALCRQGRIPVAEVRRAELDRLGGDVLHQGIAAQASAYPYVEMEQILAAGQASGELAFMLALDSVQDPQNVGSLLRTAEAVGVHGVLIPAHRAAGITPAVSRASAGAAEHLLIAQVTNLGRALEALKQVGVWAVGVEEHPRAVDYRVFDLERPLVLVLGGEGSGMGRLVAERCDVLLRIPMRGRIHSLNVSVAGGVMLYRAWHARQAE